MFYAGVSLGALFSEIAYSEWGSENYICPNAYHP
jgi:hypothetical protein